jgi:negative regulator of flagellin synthesis FlgM
MVDRITGNKGFGPLSNMNRAGNAGESKKSDSAKNTDRVNFSSALQDATKVKETMSTQESARAEKIQALKAQIQNGTYQPDLEKVASSLLPFLTKDA